MHACTGACAAEIFRDLPSETTANRFFRAAVNSVHVRDGFLFAPAERGPGPDAINQNKNKTMKTNTYSPTRSRLVGTGYTNGGTCHA